MSDLILHKKNEAFIRFECDRGIAQELSDYFTFYVPNFQFTPAYKNKIWDGKIRLFDLRSYQLYHGLYSLVENFAKERDYVIEYAKPRPDLVDDFSEYLADKFIEQIIVIADDIFVSAYFF